MEKLILTQRRENKCEQSEVESYCQMNGKYVGGKGGVRLKVNSGIFPSVHMHILMQVHIWRDVHPASCLEALIQHL